MSTQKIKGPEPQEADATESRAIATHDRKALAVGRKVLSTTGARDVILFGSRARGDYRDDSDIDLLLIHSGPKDHEFRAEAKNSATATAAILYGHTVDIDLIWFSTEEFERMRRSRNHVTAIAAEEGISMDGWPGGEEYRNDGEDYSGEMNVTDQRCYHARAHLRMLQRTTEDEEVMLMIGQQAHQALEHAMKALISAGGQRYPHHHELLGLESAMRRADQVFTHPLESPLKELNDYGGGLKYDAPFAPLGDRNELYRQVESDVQHLFQRIAELTGRDPWRDQP